MEPLFGHNFRSKRCSIIVLVVYFTWAINVLCTKSISLPLCRQIAADRALPSENKHTHTHKNTHMGQALPKTTSTAGVSTQSDLINTAFSFGLHFFHNIIATGHQVKPQHIQIVNLFVSI